MMAGIAVRHAHKSHVVTCTGIERGGAAKLDLTIVRVRAKNQNFQRCRHWVASFVLR